MVVFYGTSYGSRLQLFHGMRADSIVLAIIKADNCYFVIITMWLAMCNSYCLCDVKRQHYF